MSDKPSPNGDARAEVTTASNIDEGVEVPAKLDGVTWGVFRKAVSDELIEHFESTSVQGLVELEAGQIAWNAFRRLRDGLKGQTP